MFFFFQAEDGIRDLVRSRGLGDVYKRQLRRMLQRELDALQADPPCPLPQIELRRGAGAYVLSLIHI